MPYNYAQTMLSDQTSACSHQVHVCLSLNALSNPFAFCCEEQLQLSVLFSLFFCTGKTKWSSDFEHSISLVCLV